MTASLACEKWSDVALKIDGDMLHASIFSLFIIFCCELLKPIPKLTEHVAKPSVAQKIVSVDMLHGDRFSTIRCCAENRCCKLTSVTRPFDDRQQSGTCCVHLPQKALTSANIDMVPCKRMQYVRPNNVACCWAINAVICCVRLHIVSNWFSWAFKVLKGSVGM